MSCVILESTRFATFLASSCLSVVLRCHDRAIELVIIGQRSLAQMGLLCDVTLLWIMSICVADVILRLG